MAESNLVEQTLAEFKLADQDLAELDLAKLAADVARLAWDQFGKRHLGLHNEGLGF